MAGISVKLPLTRDKVDGYALNKTFIEMVKQNLIMLIRTNPGERIMLSDFGVGLQRSFFEQNNQEEREEIAGRIRSQVRKYLTYIELLDIQFNDVSDDLTPSRNLLSVYIRYKIVPLNYTDNITLNQTGNESSEYQSG